MAWISSSRKSEKRREMLGVTNAASALSMSLPTHDMLDLRSQDKVNETTSDFSGVLIILRYGKGSYLRISMAIGLILLSAVTVMVSAKVIGDLIELLIKPVSFSGFADDQVLKLGIIFMALECGSVVAQYLGRLHLAKATIEITYKIRLELFAKLGRLPIAYFDYQPLGRTITRLTNDVEGIESFFNGTLARLMTAAIQVTTVLIAMVLTDLHFGLLLLAASLPSLIFSFGMRKPVRHWMRIYKRRSAHVNAKLAEYLSGMPVIKVFGLERWTLHSYQRAVQEQLAAGIRTMNWNSFIRPVTVLLCSVPTLLVLWLGGENVVAGTMAIGTLVTFVRYSERFISPIRMISQEVQNIQEALVSSERVGKMLMEPEEKRVAVDRDLDVVNQPLIGEVEYRDVWMEYETGRSILQGVSFKAKAGMNIGLVGATGSGKSTTVSLLPRFYPITRGQILIDGVDLTQFDLSCIRSQLGFVSQDVAVFSGTIRENLIAATDRPLTDNDIILACKRTGLAEVLTSFGDNLLAALNHQIFDSGDNLSMGERQLIAFTRMQLRSPAIMILDEATANIDERCEALIQKATSEVMEGRTCFVIAHRLSTIIKCDLILVFDQGKIVEQGTHEELMSRAGFYASLAKKQL